MTYTLVWRHAAVAGLIALGSGNQRRLRVGAARVMYTVSEENIAVDILTVGRAHR